MPTLSDGTPYIAIGAEELGDQLGKTIVCPHCGKKHRIKDSKPPMLQFYKCGKHLYLAGIRNQSIIRKGNSDA